MTYAYYPGCSLKAGAIDYHTSTMALAKRLGVELQEMPDWVCCGASAIHQRNPIMAAGVANLLLSLAENISPQIAVLCAACYHNMKKAEVEMRHDAKKRADIEAVSEIPFNPEVNTRHFLEILNQDVGLKTLQEKVTKPLKDLRVACYYGCLLTRPPEIAIDDVEQPTIMEDLLKAAGAEPVPWSHRQECCGASNVFSVGKAVVRLVNDVLESARQAEADVVVSACPLCQMNLDAKQSAIKAKHGTDHNIPVVYFTQLLGLACGASGKDVMINKGFVDAQPVLRSKGLL